MASLPAEVFLIYAAGPGLLNPPHLPLLLMLLISLTGVLVLLRHGSLHLRLFYAGLASGPLPFLTHLAVAGPAFHALGQEQFFSALIMVVLLPLLFFHFQGPLFAFLLAARPDSRLTEQIQPLFSGLNLVPPKVLVSRFPVSAPNAWLLGLHFPRPRLVFGPGLCEQLTDDEMTALALHEAGHLQNRDNQQAWFRNIFFSFFNFIFLNLLALLSIKPGVLSLLMVLFIPLLSAWILGRKITAEKQRNLEVMADKPVLAAGLGVPLRRTLRFLWQVPDDVADEDTQLPEECRERLQAINQWIRDRKHEQADE